MINYNKKRKPGRKNKMISMNIPAGMHSWLKKRKYNMTLIFEQKCKELGWNGKEEYYQ